MGLTLLAFLSLTCGLILDTVTRGRKARPAVALLELRACRREASESLFYSFRCL